MLALCLFSFISFCYLNPFDDEAEKKKKQDEKRKECLVSYLICLALSSEENKRLCNEGYSASVRINCLGNSF